MFSTCVVAEDSPGLASAKPSDGIAIHTKTGWMVPYETTIPGTDVNFRMVPVPGGQYVMGSPNNELGRNADDYAKLVKRKAKYDSAAATQFCD